MRRRRRSRDDEEEDEGPGMMRRMTRMRVGMWMRLDEALRRWLLLV